MADVFSQKKRSWVMSRIRSCQNRTEFKFIRIAKEENIIGWRRGYPLFGRPDFVFLRARVAVFVDGCFWHGCPVHGRIPKSNRAFWIAKIEYNYDRAVEVGRVLRKKKWKVLRFWECELSPGKLNRAKLRRLKKMVDTTRVPMPL
jgi:DNA mismatch endonuclease (patch repair protein)